AAPRSNAQSPSVARPTPARPTPATAAGAPGPRRSTPTGVRRSTRSGPAIPARPGTGTGSPAAARAAAAPGRPPGAGGLGVDQDALLQHGQPEGELDLALGRQQQRLGGVAGSPVEGVLGADGGEVSEAVGPAQDDGRTVRPLQGHDPLGGRLQGVEWTGQRVHASMLPFSFAVRIALWLTGSTREGRWSSCQNRYGPVR